MSEILEFNPSVDEWIRQYDDVNEMTWAEMHGGAGNDLGVGDVGGVYISAGAISNKWVLLERFILLFDTSSLPDDCSIIGATLSLYGAEKGDDVSALPNINIYSASPASNTAIVAGDFDSLGTIAYCNTPINYTNWLISGWNHFILNENGLVAISKNSVTKIGIRNANYDVANIEPPWEITGGMWLQFEQSESDPTHKPKLIVTYKQPNPLSSLPILGITTFEALRNIEMSAAGRVHVDASGNLKYESRYGRNLPWS